jgi:TonB family protein
MQPWRSEKEESIVLVIVKRLTGILSIFCLVGSGFAFQQLQTSATAATQKSGESNPSHANSAKTFTGADSAFSQLVGRWVGLNRSEGGMGSIWEFKSDGTFTMSPAAVVDMRYRLERDTLTMSFQQVSSDSGPQVLKIRLQGDRLYAKYGDMPEQIFLVRTKGGMPGDDPIIGEWKPDPSLTDRWIRGAPAANSNQLKMSPELFSKLALVFVNNTTYTFTRDGIVKLRIAFQTISGRYDVNGQTFSLDLANETGQSKTFTGHFELRDGELCLTQPDGHTQDIYVRDDFESTEQTPEQQLIAEARSMSKLGAKAAAAQASPSSSSLMVPAQLSPVDGSAWPEKYPRTIEFQWSKVPGAASYGIEVDCFLCCGRGQWCSDTGELHFIMRGMREPTYTFDNFYGAQPGSWRVWAIDDKNQDGPASRWWEFTFSPNNNLMRLPPLPTNNDPPPHFDYSAGRVPERAPVPATAPQDGLEGTAAEATGELAREGPTTGDASPASQHPRTHSAAEAKPAKPGDTPNSRATKASVAPPAAASSSSSLGKIYSASEVTTPPKLIYAPVPGSTRPSPPPPVVAATSPSRKVYYPGEVTTPPKPIYAPDPSYTEAARKAKISGSVSLALIVEADGSVKQVSVVRSLTPDLDESAIKTVKTWRFEAGRKNGTPVPVYTDVSVTFNLY